MRFTVIGVIAISLVPAHQSHGQRAVPDTVWTQERRPAVWGTAPLALKPRLRIGGAESDIGFGRIAQVVVAPRGEVAVLDRMPEAHPVMVFSPNGRVTARFGAFGQGPAEFTTIARMAYSGRDSIVMLDSRLGRLSIWSATGVHLSDIPLREVMPAAKGIRSGAPGRVWLVEENHDGIATPVAAARSHIPLRFHLLDLHRRTRSSPSSERSLQGPIPKVPFGARVFRIPTMAGKVLTVESGRVGFASMSGTGDQVRGAWVAFPPVLVLAAERAEQVHLNEVVRKHGLPPFRPPVVAVPQYKAPVTDADAGPDGRIWLRLATEGVEGTPVVAFRTNTSPVEASLRYHDRFRYAAFESDGRFLGIVDLPGNYSRVEFGPGTIWAVESDVDGVESLVRFDLPGS